MGREMGRPPPNYEGMRWKTEVVLGSVHFRILHLHREPCGLSEILFADAESRKDQVQDVIAGGLAGERVEMTKGSI
jgi:hypothetical protein